MPRIAWPPPWSASTGQCRSSSRLWQPAWSTSWCPRRPPPHAKMLFTACVSGFTTFFTCFRLSFRQSASEAFTPAVINVLKEPAVTLGPGWHRPPLHWSARVHSLPSPHDAVFAACWHPVAGSHVSSVQGFPSSQPPVTQRAGGMVVEVGTLTALIAANASRRQNPEASSNPPGPISTAVEVSAACSCAGVSARFLVRRSAATAAACGVAADVPKNGFNAGLELVVLTPSNPARSGFGRKAMMASASSSSVSVGDRLPRASSSSRRCAAPRSPPPRPR